MGPGWGLPGDTNIDTVGVLGALNISSLRGAGYNVLTWDPAWLRRVRRASRTVDSVDYEAPRRAGAARPGWPPSPRSRLDGPGDPPRGMVGGSYGGGIQLVTAAIDCRVDAHRAGHRLALARHQPLQGRDVQGRAGPALLVRVSAGAIVDPHVAGAQRRRATPPACSATTTSTGSSTAAPPTWWPTSTVPTLLVGGHGRHAVHPRRGRHQLRASSVDAGVPAAMFWFCGGHGVCLTDAAATPTRDARPRVLAWLDRYVKQDESVDTGAPFDLRRPGRRPLHAADRYPPAAGDARRRHRGRAARARRRGRRRPGTGPAPATATCSPASSRRSPRRRAANAVDVAHRPIGATRRL